MKCLKSSRQFLLGIVGTLIAAFLVGTASAATSGQVSFNQIGIRLFGESKVTAGESYKAAKPQAVTVARVKDIPNDRSELFSTVTVNPGQTVTRAFSVSPKSTNGLDATLQFRATPIDRSSNTDITVSLIQYK